MILVTTDAKDGKNVTVLPDWFECFDGIWACASLLHVPLDQLADALARLSRALKKDGVLYASFKYGRGEREHNGRRFTDLNESGLAEL
ncbi:class I SAM-dependent methyltransferase [Thiorhodovibrio winogradskyi]|uniref:class I SAM-dependent methyltransferase n=1 Tax=Thiorhodovibrio winogradskyi TaxID=77007 RepID=UPI002E2B79F6|nr:class I SAM-dependent methyltransferase [Thiorhodovibrio winogradskyi]